MDIDHRLHTTTTTTTTTTTSSTTSDLFVCFTSRFCSFSSMKLREPTSKLSSSASLSRRLRASGSLKGGQSSPMLILTTTSNKKRGYAFENPEPSSPKVTCIGQVRVKSRKTRKANKSERNQRWPLSLCDAVMPCLGGRPRGGGGGGGGGEGEGGKMGGVKRTGSGNCGAVFARWLMAMQEDGVDVEERRGAVDDDGDGDGDGEVGGECDNVGFESVEKGGEGAEERVSVCVPPKNALLLMRCRSDPVRISALANRFVWEPSSPNEEEDSEEDEEDEEDEQGGANVESREDLIEDDDDDDDDDDDEEQVVAKWVSSDEVENQGNAECSVQADEEAPVEEEEEEETEQPKQQQNEQEEDLERVEEDEEVVIVDWSLFESFYQFVEAPETEHTEEGVESQNRVPEAESQISQICSSEVSTSEIPSTPPQEEESELNFSGDSTTEDIVSHAILDLETNESSVSETEHQQQQREQEKLSNVGLPDCLLSMLCEPKLSMEISKETWVCSRDFIRRDNHQVNPINGSDHANSSSQQEVVSKIDGSDSQKPNQQPSSDQPPRSSFSSSHPTVPSAAPSAVPSMAAVVMQKLVNAAVAHEPFVLKRCKSEPLRSSARLVPEACSWKNQNLQPHPRADLGLLAQPKC